MSHVVGSLEDPASQCPQNKSTFLQCVSVVGATFPVHGNGHKSANGSASCFYYTLCVIYVIGAGEKAIFCCLWRAVRRERLHLEAA